MGNDQVIASCFSTSLLSLAPCIRFKPEPPLPVLVSPLKLTLLASSSDAFTSGSLSWQAWPVPKPDALL